MGNKMKLKFTPLIIVAIIAILCAFYVLLSGSGGNLVGLFVIILGFIAGICGLFYFAFRKIFKTKIGKQVIAEIVLISLVAFIYFKKNGRLVLHLPVHHNKYIVVVYGVDAMDKLSSPGFLKANIDVTVPNSGIILTSSQRTKAISVIDSSYHTVRLIEAGYGIAISSDTLNCGHYTYNLDVLALEGSSRFWREDDTLVHNLKMELNCRLVSE